MLVAFGLVVVVVVATASNSPHAASTPIAAAHASRDSITLDGRTTDLLLLLAGCPLLTPPALSNQSDTVASGMDEASIHCTLTTNAS